MALQFSTIGFINFNKDYNKVLKSGAITVSFSTSVKNKEGEYENQYFNGLIPSKLAQKAKPFLNKELCEIKGVIEKAKTSRGDGKSFTNFTILEIEQYQKPKKEKNNFEITDDDMPF